MRCWPPPCASAARAANAPPPRNAKVSIVTCRDYAPAGVRAAFDRSFDQLGGLGPLLKDKTVTVKINLTGSNFKAILNRPVGESYMTHPSTVMAMTAAFAAGARRVRLVESTKSPPTPRPHARRRRLLFPRSPRPRPRRIRRHP